MRISTQTTDHGYVADSHLYIVFMNGDILYGVITADEEEKKALVNKYNSDGSLSVVIVDGQREVEVEWKTGKIEIKKYTPEQLIEFWKTRRR